MLQNGILTKDNENISEIQDENRQKLPNTKNFTFKDKCFVETFNAKNKILKVAHAFKTIRKLNLMRIVSAGQFGNDIMNNKEYQIQWNSI